MKQYMNVFKRKDKIIIFAIVAGLLLVMAIIFLPYYLTAKADAERLVEGEVIGKSFIVENNLFNPEIAVFTKSEDSNYLITNFIKISRSNLVFWKQSDINSLSTYISADEDINKLIELQKKEIENNGIVYGNDNNPEEIEESLNEAISGQEYPRTIYEETNSAQDYLKLSLERDGTTKLYVNNDLIEFSQSIASPAFALDGQSIVFTTFIPTEDHSNPSGIVYEYNFPSGEVDEIYNFSSNVSMDLAKTKNLVIYTLQSGEVGTINTETNERKNLITFEVYPPGTISEIISIDENFARILIKDVEYTNTNLKRYMEINLNDFSYEIID